MYMKHNEQFKLMMRGGLAQFQKLGQRHIFLLDTKAARQSGTCPSNIAKVLKGERKTAGGYRWEEI